MSLKGQRVTNKRTGLYCPLQDELNQRDRKPQAKVNKKQKRGKGVTVTWLEYTHRITSVLTHSGHAEI